MILVRNHFKECAINESSVRFSRRCGTTAPFSPVPVFPSVTQSDLVSEVEGVPDGHHKGWPVPTSAGGTEGSSPSSVLCD